MTVANLTDTISKRRREALALSDCMTAEEALEAALYDIRTGVNQPEALVVVYSEPNVNGVQEVGYFVANAARHDEPFFLAGMLHKAANELLEDEE